MVQKSCGSIRGSIKVIKGLQCLACRDIHPTKESMFETRCPAANPPLQENNQPDQTSKSEPLWL